MCSQYGAKYGVTGELLVEEELEAIVGRTPDDDYFYSNDKGINWQDWLDSPFYSGLNTGSYWLNRETGSGKDEWRVTSELNYTEVIYKRTILCGYSSSYRNANIFVQLVSEVPTGTEQFRQKDF